MFILFGCYSAGVAQQVEQLICNQQVAGSSPIASSNRKQFHTVSLLTRSTIYSSHDGEVPERPKGTDCKSVGTAFGGSNPPLSTISYLCGNSSAG